MPGGGEVSLEVHSDDGVELLLTGIGDHPVAHDAGVIDQDVESAEGIDGGLDQPGRLVPISYIRATGDGFPTGRDDFVNNALRRATTTGGRSVQSDADVVDHYSRALSSEGQRMRTPDSATGAGNDDNSTVEESHCCSLPYLFALEADRNGGGSPPPCTASLAPLM